MPRSIFSRAEYDGPKNAVIAVSGTLKQDVTVRQFFDMASLKNPTPKAFRIEGVTFAIQEKMGFHLFWSGEGVDEDRRLIMPLESRGWFNFEGLQGIHSPEGATGLSLASFGCAAPKSFLFLIDITKQ